MLSLPSITPRDSHELWFGSSQPYRTNTSAHVPGDNNGSPHHPPRRNGHGNTTTSSTNTHRALLPSRAQANTLSALLMEERALRARKQNIASFGYSWIRPAGCAKTMLGMKEEEAEREEAMAAAAEMAATEGMMDDDEDDNDGEDGMGLTREGDEVDEEGEGMERNLDDDIPDADAETEGLIEEGEEGLEQEDGPDEEEFMERDLDDDIPEGYPDDEYGDERLYGDDDDEDEEDDDFDNQPDLDADIPEAAGGEGMSEDMGHDLDNDIPDVAEDRSEQEGEWQHTDTEDELEDVDDDDDNEDQPSIVQNRFTASFRTSTPNSRTSGLPPPPVRRERETEAQDRFLQRWSGNGDAFDSTGMVFDDDDLRASITSQGSRRSGFGRRFPRRTGTPRDSLN